MMKLRKLVQRSRILSFFLDTPSSKWVVIKGIHFHKSFWGLVCLLIGLLVYVFLDVIPLAILLIVFGCIYILLSVIGHIYTNNKPYLKLWDKEDKPKKTFLHRG